MIRYGREPISHTHPFNAFLCLQREDIVYYNVSVIIMIAKQYGVHARIGEFVNIMVFCGGVFPPKKISLQHVVLECPCLIMLAKLRLE